MTIEDARDAYTAPAWLDAALKRRQHADRQIAAKRSVENRSSAETINALLRALNIEPVVWASVDVNSSLYHARLIQPWELGDEWGVTAGWHDPATVGVFVDSGDNARGRQHIYVGPLNSADDVVNAAYSGPPRQEVVPLEVSDYTTEALGLISHSRWSNLDAPAQVAPIVAALEALVHATLAANTDRATVAELRHRLAVIEHIVPPLTQTPDDTSLIASAIHEIARGARTPEDAVKMLGLEWVQALSGLTR
jgi:hypothetical protein